MLPFGLLPGSCLLRALLRSQTRACSYPCRSCMTDSIAAQPQACGCCCSTERRRSAPLQRCLSLCSWPQEPHDEFHGLPDHEHGDSWLLSRYWDEAFQGALGPLPEVVTSPCCSEFVVHRTRILARPRAFYMHVRWGPSRALACRGCCSCVLKRLW